MYQKYESLPILTTLKARIMYCPMTVEFGSLKIVILFSKFTGQWPYACSTLVVDKSVFPIFKKLLFLIHNDTYLQTN